MSASIVGPFDEQRLVVDGWEVPFVQAIEQTGGKILFVIDKRLGYEVSAAEFETVAELLATGIGYALGMTAWPDEELESREDRDRWFARVPHPSMLPRRLVEITGIDTDESGDADE